jgi:predicted phage terminase large subunit-like protein
MMTVDHDRSLCRRGGSRTRGTRFVRRIPAASPTDHAVGKESAEATIRGLAGFTCIADKPTGSKEVRADPFAAQVQGNNVWLVAGRWIPDFIEEAESWPHSPHLDQIDAATMAFAHLQANDDLYAGFE